jgi:hypothetical protein
VHINQNNLSEKKINKKTWTCCVREREREREREKKRFVFFLKQINMVVAM